jgi:hypothetical protein
LATVCGLTIGDYLLWNWSLNANHAVLGLISGLTLPPLAIAFVWLLVLTLARLVANVANASRDAHGARARRATGARKAARKTARVPAAPRGAATPAGGAASQAARASSPAPAAPASSPARASRKIAA